MTTPAEPTFVQNNRALTELLRELAILRTHNLSFKPGDPQHQLLMLAEGAIVCVALEHFLRVIVGRAGGPDGATLFTLLEWATAPARRLIVLPWDDQAEGIRKIVNVRNTLLHGNFAQAAREANCANVVEFFQRQYASEVEVMTKILDDLLKQIDPATGARH